jgi:hypothetical protein
VNYHLFYCDLFYYLRLFKCDLRINILDMTNGQSFEKNIGVIYL